MLNQMGEMNVVSKNDRKVNRRHLLRDCVITAAKPD